ncbi:uncharacterized protein LOC129768108 [Toxorhynchites rutilus septentrionalis]|uniref:uncharacterized protein LOC129768108 n=1 Tax=Toxorhynchites rutilus septentrionalis TaxID=329112 RepID=UPI002478D8CC|nr:uncharacterized protein LOC129768108 [Toxorhynchites rutilus septentrionalis]XP_055625504.1 uncharacterized protein LOC129768108 [Toxorhynchites rutilus septentrionalis]
MSIANSDLLGEIKRRLGTFVLQGQDVEYLKRTKSMNKLFEVKTTDHIINIIGYALNVPFAESGIAEEKLRTGDVCLITAKDRERLEKLVNKMKAKRFALLPLAMVYSSKGKRIIEETLLIKVHDSAGAFSFVDTIGRTYSNFGQFLSDNKLRQSQLYYPKNGQISFDKDNEIELDQCKVGTKNANLLIADIAIGVIGSAGAIGAIFATGGLAIPSLVISISSTAYGFGRGIENLVDAGTHGLSLDPFECAEARSHWFNVAANLLAFASAGVTLGFNVSSTLGKNVANISEVLLATRALKCASAGVSAVSMIDKIVYSVNHWKTLSLDDKIQLACAICFCFREVISLINAERLIRNSQLDGICQYFLQSSDGDLSHIRQTFLTNDMTLAIGLRLVRQFTENNIKVSTDKEFTTIFIFGYEYKMNFVLSLPENWVSKLIFMLKGIAVRFTDCFLVLRTLFSDRSIINVVFKRGDEMGGDSINYGNAINQLLEIFQLCREISNDITKLTESGMIIGAGHHFTLGSAFKIFVTIAKTRAISLLNALLALNQHDSSRFNYLRSIYSDEVIFKWVIANCNGSSDMLGKICCLLRIHDLSIDKYLCITEFHIGEDAVQIEGLIRVDQQLLYEASHPTYLIDPRFLRFFKRFSDVPDTYLKDLWKNTCVQIEPKNKSFEKLNSLERICEKYPLSILNVISYAQKMQCSDFLQFYYHSLFAFKNIERLMTQNDLDEGSANDRVFSNSQSLVSRYNTLQIKAEELGLGGYCSVDNPHSTNRNELLAVIRNQAGNAALRFGPIENAVLHLDEYPMLQLRSEILKYNRFVALKKFPREEVSDVAGKRIILMASDHLRIEVGLVPGMGSYLDEISFNASDRP